MSLSVVLAVGLYPGRLDAAGGDERSVVVLVDDRARVHPLVLDLGEKHAARIYKQAGVKMVWRLAPRPPARSEGPADRGGGVTIGLVIQAKFRGTSGTAAPFLMGAAPDIAVECGGFAYLFFDQVAAFSNVMLLDQALVLGTVAAHEIGHVLLQRQGHSAEGLMRASWKAGDWERAAAGHLLFSSSERAAVRRRISDCRADR